jgi:hypothetical protein
MALGIAGYYNWLLQIRCTESAADGDSEVVRQLICHKENIGR